MIDIHCHILPGVDDGAGNMSDALEMAELAASSGIKSIIITPHCNVPGSYHNYWNYFMMEDVHNLQREIRNHNINLTVCPGQEVYLAAGFAELLKKGEFIGLNESRYMLVEFGMSERADVAYRKLQQVIAEGYVPIVAHPERYGFVTEQQEAVYRMKDLGALLQVNRGSIKGAFGKSAMKKANEIISTFQADFVASDAHSQYSRTPYLADVHEFISEEISTEYGDWLFKVNPHKVISNEEIFSF